MSETPRDEAGPAEVRVQAMSLRRPPGWTDKSMLVLGADEPGSSGVSPSLVVTREPLPDDLAAEAPAAALEEFVARQLDAMRGSLAGFREVSRGRTGSAGSVELRIDWTSSGVGVRQWLVYAPLAGGELAVATATAGQTDFDAAEPTFRAILRTLRFG